MNKLRIKKGDTVRVLSGKDKGKTGKILQVQPAAGKIVVENINMHTRFQRAKQAGKPGKLIKFSSPMPASKVILIDPSSGRSSRIGYQFLADGSKQRIAKASDKPV